MLVGKAAEKCCFQCVKTLLICIHILTIIALIIFILMSSAYDSPHLTQKSSKTASSAELTVYPIGLLVLIVSVVGVIKENVCILTTFLVVVSISMVSNMLLGNTTVALICGIFALLIATFLRFFREKKLVVRNVARLEFESTQTFLRFFRHKKRVARNVARMEFESTQTEGHTATTTGKVVEI